ncbi:uncharacterized protein LOC134532599 isoform X5 [Bacillus rossius redtenbacheri]|uniref:uncharacterized protein LOC134532599 isoform X5 n=1 Tax=Bacillus rossius redtenbacheri TaxID=93214 RepID=UPI002FDECEF8
MWLAWAALWLHFSPGLLGTPPHQQTRKSALLKGDFVIGALFSLHHQPKQQRGDGALQCGDIREMYGIQRVEVTFMTLDRINADPALLPDVTLGVEIRDSCWYAPVALQQSIEFIRDAISPAAALEVCDSQQAPRRGGGAGAAHGRPPLVGVVGPASSSVAIQVQNLLQLFHIPQVGYSTTSKDLSDKGRFSYFLRVVPSDYYQAQVMVDLVRRHNWTYVSAVNTDENYGHSGIQAFRELAERADVCIAKEDSVLSNADDEVFEAVLRKLAQDQNARVVVCFCEGMTVRGLLRAARRLGLTGRFLFLGSDGWADRADVTDGYEHEATGSITIRINSPHVAEFDSYYLGLDPFTNLRNPWFREFWQFRFNCVLPLEGGDRRDSGAPRDASSPPPGADSPPVCTGKERLKERYRADPKLSFVMKALYTMAYGLHNMVQAVCGNGSRGVCPGLFPFDGSLFKVQHHELPAAAQRLARLRARGRLEQRHAAHVARAAAPAAWPPGGVCVLETLPPRLLQEPADGRPGEEVLLGVCAVRQQRGPEGRHCVRGVSCRLVAQRGQDGLRPDPGGVHAVVGRAGGGRHLLLVPGLRGDAVDGGGVRAPQRHPGGQVVDAGAQLPHPGGHDPEPRRHVPDPGAAELGVLPAGASPAWPQLRHDLRQPADQDQPHRAHPGRLQEALPHQEAALHVRYRAGGDHGPADRRGSGRVGRHAGAGAAGPDAAVPRPGPRRAGLRHLADGRRGAARLRRPPRRALHAVRAQDAQRARELQRGQVHRLRHVHHVRHLGRLRAHLLRQRLQDHHAVHVRHAERHGDARVPVPAQAVHHPAAAREEQPLLLHHLQEHPLPHRQSRCIRHLCQGPCLLPSRRVRQGTRRGVPETCAWFGGQQPPGPGQTRCCNVASSAGG